MIYFIGNTHGAIDFSKVMSLHDKAKNGIINMSPEKDFLVVLGDWGVVWQQKPGYKEIKMLRYWEKCPWTTLVVDGNHENFDRLFSYPEVEFGNNIARKIGNNIYNLKRGEIYDIDGVSAFVFGGGLSIDKEQRIEGVSWWREELPSTQQMDNAITNLERKKYCVDLVLTHEAPKRFVPRLLGTNNIDYALPESMKYNSPLANFFDYLYEVIDFKAWLFGHYHTDEAIEDIKKLYDFCHDSICVKEYDTQLKDFVL